jgi:hypothetical protein
MRTLLMFQRGLCGLILAAVVGGAASAAPGDVHRVTAERANLRAGPSDQTDVRAQLERGDELIELQREGKWFGVRAIRMGKEGWIYGDLVELTSPTRLERGAAAAGFRELSPGFDSLIHSIDERLGYRMVDRVEQVGSDTLRVMPTQDWLIYGGRSDHMLAALAFYKMWKAHQGDRPVTLALLNRRGQEYITIADGKSGPTLSIHPVGED